MSKKKNLTRELSEELDSLDMMLSSLVEVLERKGIMTEDEWEKQIKVNVEKTVGKGRYRDIQFADKEEDFVEMANTQELVPVYPPINLKLLEKERKERVANEVARTRHKKKLSPKRNSFHVWDWLNMTREELEGRCKQSGEGKCIICDRDTSHSRAKILCQWHVAAFTKWRKAVNPRSLSPDTW
jgi:hypothetical protein